MKRRVLQLRNCPGDKVEGRLEARPRLGRRDMEVIQRRPTSLLCARSLHPFLLFLSHFEAALLTQCSSACLDTYWPRNWVNFISRQPPASPQGERPNICLIVVPVAWKFANQTLSRRGNRRGWGRSGENVDDSKSCLRPSIHLCGDLVEISNFFFQVSFSTGKL